MHLVLHYISDTYLTILLYVDSVLLGALGFVVSLRPVKREQSFRLWLSCFW
jgi:hypothetical protein